MGNRLFSLLFITFFVFSSTLLMVVAFALRLVTQPFDPQLRVLHRLSCYWAALYTWFNPRWCVKIEGKQNVNKESTYVIVSNHQSLVDVLAACRLFIHFKWVAKDELFRVPLVGLYMRLNNYIRIRRGARESIRQMMLDCSKALRGGSSVFLFPEGTRSETGEVGRFRSGAFSLAKGSLVPILPVVISGSKDALPKGSLISRTKQTIRVRILEEVPVDVVVQTSTRELADHVREEIIKNLREMDLSGATQETV